MVLVHAFMTNRACAEVLWTKPFVTMRVSALLSWIIFRAENPICVVTLLCITCSDMERAIEHDLVAVLATAIEAMVEAQLRITMGIFAHNEVVCANVVYCAIRVLTLIHVICTESGFTIYTLTVVATISMLSAQVFLAFCVFNVARIVAMVQTELFLCTPVLMTVCNVHVAIEMLVVVVITMKCVLKAHVSTTPVVVAHHTVTHAISLSSTFRIITLR